MHVQRPHRTAMLLATLAWTAAAPSGMAQEAREYRLTLPADLCTWDWGKPASARLLDTIADRRSFHRNMAYLAETCPGVLCQWDWSNRSAARVRDQMGDGAYLDDMITGLASACPEVALLLTEGPTASIEPGSQWDGGEGGVQGDAREGQLQGLVEGGREGGSGTTPDDGDDEPDTGEEPNGEGPNGEGPNGEGPNGDGPNGEGPNGDGPSETADGDGAPEDVEIACRVAEPECVVF